ADLHRIAAAIEEFRKSGKPVIAVGDSFSQGQYLLAASADEIWMHPQGAVLLTGYGAYSPFFAEGLDKLDVEVHVFKVGTYKSAVEPFIRNDMSEPAKEANRAFLSVLWGSYLDHVARQREIERASLESFLSSLDQAAIAADGDLAKMALDHHLVDALKTHHEMRAAIAEKLGAGDADSYKRVGYREYLKAIGTKSPAGAKARIAVITVEGAIVDGRGAPNEAGAERIVPQIRRATRDDSVKAIVLRVNSPGGSAFASELIRQALVDAQKKGKPVVASFGPVAASGGYWISSTSDEIWAQPTTITGSIGIFGLFFGFNKSLADLGIHTDGVGTTPFSDAFDPTRPFNPRVGAIIQKVIEHGYDEFLSRVATGRKMSKEEVDRIGQGRVWAGATARKLGLVDGLGSLADAVKAAAKRAGLEEGSYSVRHYDEKLSPFEQFLVNIAGQAGTVGQRLGLGQSSTARLTRHLEASLERLRVFRDPHGAYALCMACTVQ
ncbi:MAG: signal peptide peptidase SppA, partial [Alphaproteobacteria bacterium]